MRLVPTGHLLFFASPKKSKQKKGDPDVQVCFADFPLSAFFFRRVRTSRAMRVVEQAHAFSRNKESCVRLDVGERVAALNICDGLGSLERAVVWETACVAKPSTPCLCCLYFQAALDDVRKKQPEKASDGVLKVRRDCANP